MGIIEKSHKGTIIADNNYLNEESHFPEGPSFMVRHAEPPVGRTYYLSQGERKAVDVSNLTMKQRTKSKVMLNKYNDATN